MDHLGYFYLVKNVTTYLYRWITTYLYRWITSSYSIIITKGISLDVFKITGNNIGNSLPCMRNTEVAFHLFYLNKKNFLKITREKMMKQDVYISLYKNIVYIQRDFGMSNYFTEITYVCVYIYAYIMQAAISILLKH